MPQVTNESKQTPNPEKVIATADKGLVFHLKRLVTAINWRSYGMIIVLLLVALAFDVLTEGKFFAVRNLAQLARQAAILVVVASGVALLIIQREIDLSIGSAVYLTGLAAATAQTQWGYSTLPAVLFSVVLGLLMGAFQGFWVSRLNMPSFVVTLAGLLGFRGIGYVWSNAATYSPMNSDFVAISESYIPPSVSIVLVILSLVLFAGVTIRRWFFQRSLVGAQNVRYEALILPVVGASAGAALMLYIATGFRGIPMAVLVALLVAGVLSFIASHTRFGRQMYTIGGNREAAFLSGINIRNNILISFVLMGGLYSIGGILATARLNAISPAVGEFLELDAIAAAVIGGVSLSGGIGTVHGAIVGALLLTAVDNGLSLMNVSSFIQLVAKALLLGFAVLFDGLTRPGGRKLF
jgi:D-xylose transport system permease protein